MNTDYCWLWFVLFLLLASFSFYFLFCWKHWKLDNKHNANSSEFKPNVPPPKRYRNAVQNTVKTKMDPVAALHEEAISPIGPYEKPYQYLEELEWPEFDPTFEGRDWETPSYYQDITDRAFIFG